MARTHAEGARLFRVRVGLPGPNGGAFVGRTEVYGPYQTIVAARAQGTRALRYARGYVARIESTPVAWEAVE